MDHCIMQLVTGSTNSSSYYNDFSAENLKVLVGKVGYFKGTYGIPQAWYIWVMVWERAGTMLIILSVADNCTVPTNKIEPSVAFFVDLFNPSLYMNTQISQHLPQMDMMSVEVSTNTAA